MFLRTFSSLKRTAMERRPDVIVLVDFPDFNLKLAKSLSRRGFRVVYYISPQLWAWRGYRIRTIKKYVDLLISILPFEKDWYALRGVSHVEYVGSPLAREVHTTEGKEAFVRRHGLELHRPIVALLPGSRHKEIVRVLPVMLDAASRMLETRSDLQFVIAVGGKKQADDVRETMSQPNSLPYIKQVKPLLVVGETFNAIGAADAAAHSTTSSYGP
jgi:lipid-A-disaccharide synthase